MLKKISTLILSGLLFCSSVALAKDHYWYLAAAFVKPGKKISQLYNQQHQGRLFIISGSCGQLLSKIETTGKGGLFTPSSEHFYEIAQAKKLVKNSRFLLVQTPVLGLSQSGIKKITRFADIWQDDIRLTVGNPKMTLGKAFIRLTRKLGPQQQAQLHKNIKSEVLTVNQIISYLSLDIVDGGLVFDSLARMNHLKYFPVPQQYAVKKEHAYVIHLNLPEDHSELTQAADFILAHRSVFNDYGFITKRQET